MSAAEKAPTVAPGLSWKKMARRIRVPMGFLFAIFFLLMARPTGLSLLLSLLLVVPGLLLRGYASGYVNKNEELTRTGPYAYTRNPLYLGSMMIAFGFSGASRSWWVLAVLAALFAAIYVPTIRGEEEYLRQKFVAFNEYAARVPRLFPRMSAIPFADAGSGAFSAALYRQHREYNAAMGAAAIYAALVLRYLLQHHSAT